MTTPNHLAGGLVFTGVFGAFCGVNILHDPGLIAMTLAAATLPDIDLPSSLWGRTFKPISKIINRKFGHRTITHSLLCLLLGYGLTIGITSLLNVEAPYPTVFLLAYASHLIFDAMTIQGVPLFYPYNKAPCVIPSDPKLRLKSSNPRSEIAVFGFFVISGLFLQPLMADGFWTSYNRLFGTMVHLQSEFEKSEDLLQVTYRYREATSEHTGSGFAVECTGTIANLWNPDTGWERLDASPTSSRTILEVIPEHTGRTYDLVRQSFVAISPDSLDRLLRNQVTYHLQLSANEAFTANYETFAENKKTNARSLNLDLVEHLTVFELPGQLATTAVKYHTSPRIRSLEARIQQLQTKHQEQTDAATALNLRIQTLETIRDQATDIYEEQRAVEELAKLKKKTATVDDITAQVQELRTQIIELEATDQIKYEEKVAAAELKYRSSQSPELELTGIVTLVEFENP